jgi:hypothetical protein
MALFALQPLVSTALASDLKLDVLLLDGLQIHRRR